MCDENKGTVCRVCLCTKENNTKSITEVYKKYTIFEYINKIAKLNITLDDKLPDKICQSCYADLETCVTFIEKCKKSDNTLKNYNKSNDDFHIKIEVEPILKVENTSVIDDDYESYDALEENVLEKCNVVEDKGLKFICHDCGGSFKSKCKLRVHWKNTHLLSSLICPYCKRSFKSYKPFNNHVKNKIKMCTAAANPGVRIEGVGRSRIFFCKECVYKTKRIKDMDTHLRTHSGEKPYICNLCPNRYSQISSLQTHQETFHKKYLTEITCQYCGKHVKGRGTAYRHLKMHKEGKTQCTVCKIYVTKRNLGVHMRRHTGIKTYTCEKCASTFYTSAELCNHRRWVHKKGEPFKCELCDYKSRRAHIVKKHQMKHTDKNIACTICGMFFHSPQKLKAHQRIHFGERNFDCPQCDKKFLSNESVRKHMVRIHLSIVDQKPIIIKTESLARYDNTTTIIVKSSPPIV